MATAVQDPAASAYARFAPYYDAFTRATDHRPWLHAIERQARRFGLAGADVLDVACGTGRSLIPLAELGYRCEGCDISGPMLDVARSRLPGMSFWEADMRSLRAAGPFDWVTCVNDALNYLLEGDALRVALASMASVLRPGALLTFDLTTLTEHRDGFARTWVVEDEDAYLCWHGRGCDANAPGEPGIADIDIFVRCGDTWSRDVSRHRQRWWGPDDVRRAARSAGLEVLGRFATAPDGSLVADDNQRRWRKLVYFLRRREEVLP